MAAISMAVAITTSMVTLGWSQGMFSHVSWVISGFAMWTY